MLKHILFWTFILILMESCNRPHFEPGLYGDAGMSASTPDQDDYVCGFLRLIHNNTEKEHITFDFGDVLMDVGLSGKKIIDGSWSYANTSKQEIIINYSYGGVYYSENYLVIFPAANNTHYILKLVTDAQNTFEIYLDFFE
jgi:hypothetical protein